MTLDADKEPLDRRVRRTRSAIILAFNRLILERGYGSLTPSEVAAAADVGRSTFYAHFRGIDDVLAQALDAVLRPLAIGCLAVRPAKEAQRVIEHVWENRRLAHLLFTGDAQPVVLRCFAEQFEKALQGFYRDEALVPMLKPELIALQLASSQLAVLGAWVSGRTGHSAEEITLALQVSGHASAVALSHALEPCRA